MESVKDELTALYSTWMGAIQRKDFDTLQQILGEEYAYAASGQGRFTRQGWLDTVPVYDIHNFELRGLDVQRHGDVAVAFANYWQEATVRGSRRSGSFLITDVWVKRDGRWQVVARSSILDAPA